MLHVVDRVVLVAGFSVHTGEPFHGLNGHEIAAVFVLKLELTITGPSLVIRRATYVSVPIYAAMIPCTSQACLAILFSFGVVSVLIQISTPLMTFI